ncbi:MAG TPA: hypothetical protein ENI05_06040, partial [Porticoccus sp.]|nr:hypothetical protein [Porticoccus sp.]
MKDNFRTITANNHSFMVGDREMLFHVPTSSVFELDETSSQILQSASTEQGASLKELQNSIVGF